MMTECPKCKTKASVAGAYERPDMTHDGKSNRRVICHSCSHAYKFHLIESTEQRSYGGESCTNPLDQLSSIHPYSSVDLCLMGDGTIRDVIQVID